MEKAELFNAYGWTCDNCGRDNLAPQLHVTKQEKDCSIGVTYVFCPKKVVCCAFCQTKYRIEQD